ncbi:MAG: secretin N-terminal domain-containing protein [Planctomycetota bacterium]
MLSTMNRSAAQEPESRVTLAGQLPLSRVVDYAASRSGIVMTYDSSDLESISLTIRTPEPASTDVLWPLIHSSLHGNSLVIISSEASDFSYQIVQESDAYQLSALKQSNGRLDHDRITSYVKLRLSLESIAVDAVRSIADVSIGQLSPGSQSGTSIEFSEATGDLFIGGRRDRVELFLGLLESVRALDDQVIVKAHPVSKGSAPEVIEAVQSIARARATLGARTTSGVLTAGTDDESVIVTAPEREIKFWRSIIQDVMQPARVYSDTYQITGVSPARLRDIFESALLASDPARDSLRAFANPLTDSLTVWTDDGGHALLAEIITDAQSPSQGTRRSLRSIPIRHRSAEQLAADLEVTLAALSGSTVNDLQAHRSSEDPGSSDAAFDVEPTSSSPESATNQAISVDDETNSLLVIGTPLEIEQIRRLVADLDVPTTQVRLEVLLLSLTESQTLDLGIEIDKVEITDGTTIRLSSLFGIGLQAGSSALPGAGPGFTGVVLDPGDFSVLVQALETVNDGRILSMPSVLVSNNQSADFNSVLQQPVTSLNASDTVATTSFGGFEDAGTNISVAPQILAGDRLILNYSVTLSSFVGESSDPSTPPPRQQNQLSSAVTIPDGYTVALGGIELTTEGEGESRIPLLGSIPWLGELFKTRSISDSRTRFYVLIRANIYRDPMLERLRYASEALATDIGIPSDWPGVEPRIMR